MTPLRNIFFVKETGLNWIIVLSTNFIKFYLFKIIILIRALSNKWQLYRADLDDKEIRAIIFNV
jgi:hypothetical protein